jgi:hypothetical protein
MTFQTYCGWKVLRERRSSQINAERYTNHEEDGEGQVA